MKPPVFPAAAPAEQPHPRGCACLACIDTLIAEVSTPLILPAPRTDPARFCDRPPHGWVCNLIYGHDGPCPARRGYVDDVTRHDIWPDGYTAPEASRGTRGPQRGAGRRPSGPGRRRGGGSVGGEGKPGGCARVLVAAAVYVVLAYVTVAAVVWWLVAR